MNFLTLKMGFKKYLQQQNISLNLGKNGELSSSSLLKHEDIFKQYLSEEHQVDFSELSLDFSELMNLDVDNGELLQDSDIDNQNQEFALEILNGMLEDEEYKNKLDLNGDNSLNDDEIKGFLEFAYQDTENGKNISLEQLFDGFEKLKKGLYQKPSTPDENSNGVDDPKPTPLGDTLPDKSDTLPDKTDILPDKDIDISSQNDIGSLESQKTSLQAQEQEKIAALANAKATSQQQVDAAKQKYDEAVKKDQNITSELQNRRSENLNAIQEQETQIGIRKNDIAMLDSQISQDDMKLITINSELTALRTSLNSLNSVSFDEATKGLIEQQKQEIQNRISQAEAEYNSVQADLNSKKEQKAQKEKELAEAQEQLSKLQAEKTDIDNEILANCGEETKAALLEFNQAKDAQIKAVLEAENALKAVQAQLREIEVKINQLKAQEKAQEISKQYSHKAELFTDEEFQWNFVEGETQLPYGIIGPKNPKEGEKLPVLIFLHGKGEIGDADGLKNVVGQNFMGDLENFNGYIVCPNLQEGMNWDSDDVMKMIGEVMDDVSDDYNIDTDSICLSGHSLGGLGTIYATEHDRFENLTGYQLKKAVILSGIAKHEVNAINIPVKSFVGSQTGDESCRKQMEWHLREYIEQ